MVYCGRRGVIILIEQFPNSQGDCPHWRKVIENWINVAVLLCFLRARGTVPLV